MVLLGDHVHLPAPGRPAPAEQLVEAFSSGAAAAVAVQTVGEAELAKVGVCRGQPCGQGVYRCREIVEKPSVDLARARLASPDLPAGRYLAHAGIYLFTPEIFDCLEPLVRDRPDGREVGLTEAQQMLLERRPEEYLLVAISGSTHDTGTPEGYLETQAAILRG